jgi:hypothetical protein
MCTGHADHLDPDLLPAEWGVVVVKSGPLAPAWVSIGQAPAVGAADVYQAMRHLMDHYEELKLAAVDKAEAVFHAWQWGTVTAPLVTWVKNNS